LENKNRLFYGTLFIIAILTITFVLLPLLRLITLPSAGLIISAFKDRSAISSIINSISYSFITAILSLIFGIPLAFLMAKNKFGKLEKTIETITDLPLAVPHTVAGIALLFVFGRKGLVGSLFYNGWNVKITGTGIAIIIAMMFVSLPYLVNSARDGFKSVNYDLEKASHILGASPFYTFRAIYLPLSSKSIETGFLLTWARAISEFGAVAILAYYPMTAPVKIYDAFTQYNLAVSTAIAAVLLIICLTIFLILRLVINRK
jgi:molybdate/tungstate transport system permease protein